MTIETANRLYELRKKKGLSQEELAERLGVSRQAVSKWERSEASPDTDNLIALAKIYDLSLDELIYGEKTEQADEQSKEDGEQKADTEQSPDDEKAGADSSGIFIESGEDKIKIAADGMVIKDKDGDTVKIGWKGLKINVNKDIGDKKCEGVFVIDNDDDDDDDDDDEVIILDADGKHFTYKKTSKSKFWLELPYAVICAVAYLVFGFLNICGGWAQSWIIFITIPIYYSLIEAIYNRRFSNFAYPVLTAFLYLYFGMYLGNWHPSWLIFLTVAIYQPIASALDKKIKEREQKRAEKQNK